MENAFRVDSTEWMPRLSRDRKSTNDEDPKISLQRNSEERLNRLCRINRGDSKPESQRGAQAKPG